MKATVSFEDGRVYDLELDGKDICLFEDWTRGSAKIIHPRASRGVPLNAGAAPAKPGKIRARKTKIRVLGCASNFPAGLPYVGQDVTPSEYCSLLGLQYGAVSHLLYQAMRFRLGNLHAGVGAKLQARVVSISDKLRASLVNEPHHPVTPEIFAAWETSIGIITGALPRGAQVPAVTAEAAKKRSAAEQFNSPEAVAKRIADQNRHRALMDDQVAAEGGKVRSESYQQTSATPPILAVTSEV